MRQPSITKWPALLLALLLFSVSAARVAPAAEEGEGTTLPTKEEQLASLRQEAASLAESEPGQAAEVYLKIFRLGPVDPGAEEALWQAALLRKASVEKASNPNWGQVRDLYRLFVTEYPRSAHFEEAYLELGISHFRMHFFPEALSYFKLFLKRYPKSSLAPWARYWQGRTLFETGRLEEAMAIYQELREHQDKELRAQTAAALGDLYFARGRYDAALHAYRTVEKEVAPHSELRWELVRRQGKTLAHLGEEKEARELLYQYLNVVPESPHRSQVLFELAESYRRQHLDEAAQQLYGSVFELDSPEERPTILSRFRQAQYQDRPQAADSRWRMSDERSGPAGDRPYLAVLNSFYEEPVAQDARFGLLQRYLAREDFEPAYPLAKAYLEHQQQGDQRLEAVRNILGRILVARLEVLLQQEKYQEAYDLYREEYSQVKAYPQGRLLVLVGRALQALKLYKQASIIYYRALERSLTDEEKVDLYFRRANVYLLQEDFTSAERLLAYLREIYAGSREMGEVSYLSGRLREVQNKPAEALKFYAEAARILTLQEKKDDYAQAHLRLLFRLVRFEEAAKALARYREEGWLPGAEVQQWYRQLGNVRKGQSSWTAATAAYEAGLAADLPQENETAQVIHLELGDVYSRLGEIEKGRTHYEAARGGTNPLLRKIAEERLNEVQIDTMFQKLSTRSAAAGRPCG